MDKEFMTNKEFEELKDALENAYVLYEYLQEKYRKQTGRRFIPSPKVQKRDEKRIRI